MKKLPKEWSWLTKEEIMKRCWQEGYDEGFRLATEKLIPRRIAERMIIHGISDQTISECTELPLDEVRELRNGQLKPLSPDQFKAECINAIRQRYQ